VPTTTTAFGSPTYGITRRLAGTGFADALDRVRAALAAEGFGVISTIDLQAALRDKLGEAIPAYTILGACNPRLAHRALGQDPAIGLLLPCNVVVAQEGPDVVVSAADPIAMFRAAGPSAVGPIASEARERLERAIAAA
jgi:uncharacterized protein (DUF302 family)